MVLFLNWIKFVCYEVLEGVTNALRLRRRYTGNPNITGKIVVITGANTGIGKVTALEMAKRGANVIIGCRDVEKGNYAVSEIAEQLPYSKLKLFKLDLASLESVRQFAKQVSQLVHHIDILVNNAGVMMCPKERTADGFEMQFGTNHLGHFLLTMLLMDRLKAAPKARIVVVSSIGHMVGKIHFDDINLDKDYGRLKAYSQSKLANILFARELAMRLVGTNINTYSLHPGHIRTELWRHLGVCSNVLSPIVQSLIFIGPELGAQTTLYCALDDSVAKESGRYYDNCKVVEKNTSNVTDEAAEKLWNLSCDLVKLDSRLRLD